METHQRISGVKRHHPNGRRAFFRERPNSRKGIKHDMHFQRVGRARAEAPCVLRRSSARFSLELQTERYTWSKLIHTPFPRWLVANLWRNGVREFVACFDNITEVERYIEHLHACHTSPVLEMEQVHPLLARKAAARSCSI